MTLYPVILSGGAGTRLWPLSREHYPKPLMPLVSERSLLQDTALRLDGVPDLGDALYVCNEEHRFLVAEQVSQLGRHPATIILEPEGRNTAPALTLAALYLVQRDADALMIVMPADHVMTQPAAFVDAVQQGRMDAANGALVTFGIVPDRPETGYGYIRRGNALQGSTAYEVARFVEKPDQQTAQEYIESGEYYWNSGIFLMRADRWLEEVSRFAPAILEHCHSAMENGRQDCDFFRVSKADFLSCPSDSIDYAVMEKSDRVVVLPLDAGWSDVGAWPALWDVCERDVNGNVMRGDVLAEDTRNAFLLAQHRCLATVGVENIIVIETADAVLVASRDKAQNVKAIVSRLKAAKRDEYKTHRLVYRPWGSYEGIDAGSRFQVKRLTVKPGAQLSLQMHHHRAEHWVVVRGTARVTCGDQVFNLHENESTYIPMGERHRLENPGTIPLEVIEIQSGSYLGEDDIVRYEDVYDRVQEIKRI
jgi:mannose-1-phosphate guanylyltransferase/mannose-6-phosphate isomerase